MTFRYRISGFFKVTFQIRTDNGWAIYRYVFEFRHMATPNELQTRNFDSLLVIPSAARNNMFSLERFEILKTYFQSQCCVAETVRILKRNMGLIEHPPKELRANW